MKLYEVLNRCDVAYSNGESLSWFYDEENEEIHFNTIEDHLCIVKNNESFSLVDNEVEIMTEYGETIFIELYCLVKPSF